MSDLYMKLDDAVDRVILLSQQNGNLAEYGKTPEDKEWLRNELEQICHLPCDVGPLPKWNAGNPKESGWYLCTLEGGLYGTLVNAVYYDASMECWDINRGWLDIVGWMSMPKPMRRKDEYEEDEDETGL